MMILYGSGRLVRYPPDANSIPIIRPGPWWRHQIETFSPLLALCAGNSPVTGEFLSFKSSLCSHSDTLSGLRRQFAGPNNIDTCITQNVNISRYCIFNIFKFSQGCTVYMVIQLYTKLSIYYGLHFCPSVCKTAVFNGGLINIASINFRLSAFLSNVDMVSNI